MIKLLGSRGAAVVSAIFLTLIGGSTEAFGQQTAMAQVTPAVLGVPAIAAPQNLSVTLPNIQQTTQATALPRPPLAPPSVSAAAPAIAREASWLYAHGWGLAALVDRYSSAATPLDTEASCLATAVYFEARGEALEGQLAVARVVMNRAASGKYPSTWCATVKQPSQFSFVQRGRFPAIDSGSDAWRKAQAITRLAMSNAVPSLSTDVLWYHANYVAPSWGRRLTRVSQIGAHIFYRA
jgi:spore germination cell wall hydrolase CwlJ-like protein